MGKKWKRFVASSAAFFMLAGNVTAYGEIVTMRLLYDGKMHDYKAEEIKITIDGKGLDSGDMPPVIINDRTLVPIRTISEAMGAEVAWNNETKEAYITKDNNIVVFQMDNKTGSKNGTNFTMDVPVKVINERTMIPVRALSEALDCTVDWNATTRTAAISSGASSIAPAEPEQPSTPETPATPETPVTPVTPETPATPETPTTTPTTPQISVNKVNVPAGLSANQVFSIQATGAIQKYENVYVDDNRIVLDVYDAKMALPSDNINVSTSSMVSGIRCAEHDVDGHTVTRIVLDLYAPVKYEVTQSGDKSSIQVTFAQNTITGIHFNTANGTDTVTISGNSPFVANFEELASPKRLVIDIPNAVSQMNASPDISGCVNITDVRPSMYNENTARVVLEMNDTAQYTSTQSGNSLIVSVSRSTLNNMSYNPSTKVLTLNKEQTMNINEIQHTDNYLMLNYKLTLPGDFENVYGHGKYQLDDSVLNHIEVSTVGGKTSFVFDEKVIQAITVTEDASHYYFNVKSPKEVYSKVVMLDPGHGGKDPGTNGNGLVEKDLNLSIAQKVYARFEKNDSVKAYITRLDDTYPTNPNRAKMANQTADLFVSIHMNAVPNNPTASGTEVFYMDRTGVPVGRLTSKVAAATVLQNLIQTLGTTNRGVKDGSDLIVLNQSTMPAILIEVCFITNMGNALMISQDEKQEAAAQAIYEGILDSLNRYTLR